MNKKLKITLAMILAIIFFTLNYIVSLLDYNNLIIILWRSFVFLIYVLFAIFAITFLISAVILFFKKRSTYLNRIYLTLFLISLLLIVFTTNKISSYIFLDAIDKANIEYNKEKIDENIPFQDVNDIHKLVKNNYKYNVLEMKYYVCGKDIKKETEGGLIVPGPNESKKCQDRDILVEIGYNHFCGNSCGNGYSKFLLLRKVNGIWEVIEDLGESRWMS